MANNNNNPNDQKNTDKGTEYGRTGPTGTSHTSGSEQEKAMNKGTNRSAYGAAQSSQGSQGQCAQNTPQNERIDHEKAQGGLGDRDRRSPSGDNPGTVEGRESSRSGQRSGEQHVGGMGAGSTDGIELSSDESGVESQGARRVDSSRPGQDAALERNRDDKNTQNQQKSGVAGQRQNDAQKTGGDKP